MKPVAYVAAVARSIEQDVIDEVGHAPAIGFLTCPGLSISHGFTFN